jgi:uncharacterized delta-60 repeat protein
MKKHLQILICIFLFATNANAQPGTNDPSFDPGMGCGADVHTLTLQPDGTIIVGGVFESYDGTTRRRIARANPDGTLDGNFAIGYGFNGPVYATALQTNGKIIAAGDFSQYGSTSTGIGGMVRINFDGVRDITFSTSSGFDMPVYCIALQPDGKIIAGGAFFTFNGSLRNSIARVNTDGSNDATFNPGTGFDEGVLAIALQNDGKIVVAGSFTSFNGTPRNYLARLNSNGTLDATFNIGTGFDYPVSAVAIQPDGKIIVGGDFTSINGVQRNRIARLNANGSLDATFDPGYGFDYYIHAMVIQPDGKIIVGGYFTECDGIPINNIARLNANGTLDQSFNPGAGFDDIVLALALQPDGHIVVGGRFTAIDGTPRANIARLIGGGGVNIDQSITNGIRIFPNPSASEFTVLSEQSGSNFQVTDNIGKVVAEGALDGMQTQVDLANHAPGLYTITIEGQAYKLVKL